jgi:hypothetical protein
MQRVFIKKCFLFMVGSVCDVKRLTIRRRNSLKEVRKSQMMLVARTTVKRFIFCEFRRTGKETGPVYQCREINVFFPGSNIACFMFYIYL